MFSPFFILFGKGSLPPCFLVSDRLFPRRNCSLNSLSLFCLIICRIRLFPPTAQEGSASFVETLLLHKRDPFPLSNNPSVWIRLFQVVEDKPNLNEDLLMMFSSLPTSVVLAEKIGLPISRPTVILSSVPRVFFIYPTGSRFPPPIKQFCFFFLFKRKVISPPPCSRSLP